MNDLDPKPSVLTITIQIAETKVTQWQYPPLPEAGKSQLLNIHKSTLWFKFNWPQEIKQLGSEKLLDLNKQ